MTELHAGDREKAKVLDLLLEDLDGCASGQILYAGDVRTKLRGLLDNGLELLKEESETYCDDCKTTVRGVHRTAFCPGAALKPKDFVPRPAKDDLPVEGPEGEEPPTLQDVVDGGALNEDYMLHRTPAKAFYNGVSVSQPEKTLRERRNVFLCSFADEILEPFSSQMTSERRWAVDTEVRTMLDAFEQADREHFDSKRIEKALLPLCDVLDPEEGPVIIAWGVSQLAERLAENLLGDNQ